MMCALWGRLSSKAAVMFESPISEAFLHKPVIDVFQTFFLGEGRQEVLVPGMSDAEAWTEARSLSCMTPPPEEELRALHQTRVDFAGGNVRRHSGSVVRGDPVKSAGL